VLEILFSLFACLGVSLAWHFLFLGCSKMLWREALTSYHLRVFSYFLVLPFQIKAFSIDFFKYLCPTIPSDHISPQMPTHESLLLTSCHFSFINPLD
jgi:hypothetical protein